MAVRARKRCTPSDTAWFASGAARLNFMTLPMENCPSTWMTQVGLVGSLCCEIGAQLSPTLNVSNASPACPPPAAPRLAPRKSVEPLVGAPFFVASKPVAGAMLSRTVDELPALTQVGSAPLNIQGEPVW